MSSISPVNPLAYYCFSPMLTLYLLSNLKKTKWQKQILVTSDLLQEIKCVINQSKDRFFSFPIHNMSCHLLT